MPERTSPQAAAEEDPWLTVQEVSEQLKIHPQTVRIWIRDERLNATKAGKGYRVRRSEVERALSATGPASRRQETSTSGGDGSGMGRTDAPRQTAENILVGPRADERA
jgi:excisionase family DNA binding protein